MSERATPAASTTPRATLHLVAGRDGDPPVLVCEACCRFIVLRPGETDPACPTCGAPPCSGCGPLLAPSVQA